MNEKNEPINFLVYKNKFSNNNHKNSRKNYLPLLNQAKKIKIINKSNSNVFPILNSYNENNILKRTKSENENEKQKLIIHRKIKIRNKQNNLGTLNKSLVKNENNQDLRTKTLNQNTKIIKKLNNIDNYNNFYKFICLVKDTNKGEIEKVNSPLVKYFLYNIFQNNKRNSKFHRFLKTHLIKENSKNNVFKPNFLLIKKILMDKYNNLNNSSSATKTKNIFKNIPSKNFKNNKNNDERLNTEENSSSENNQINSIDLDKLIKKEENCNEIPNLKLKTIDSNRSSFLHSKSSKIIKILEDPNIKLEKMKNLKMNNIYKDLSLYKRPYLSFRKYNNF